MLQAGNPGKSRDVCDHPGLFLTNNHAILKCLLASYSTVRSHSNNVTVIARIQSDLMDLLIIALTFVCVIEARGQTQFLFLKHSGCRPN